MPRTLDLPPLPTVRAHAVAAPPSWAWLERELFALMEASARRCASPYFEPGGAPLMAEDVDGLFYALGVSDPTRGPPARGRRRVRPHDALRLR